MAKLESWEKKAAKVIAAQPAKKGRKPKQQVATAPKAKRKYTRKAKTAVNAEGPAMITIPRALLGDLLVNQIVRNLAAQQVR